MTRWRRARREDAEASTTPEQRERQARWAAKVERNHRIILAMAELAAKDAAASPPAAPVDVVAPVPVADPPPAAESERRPIGFRPPV